MIPRLRLAWGGLAGTGPKVTILGEAFMLPSNAWGSWDATWGTELEV